MKDWVSYPAFEKWLINHFGHDVDGMSRYLLGLVTMPEQSDSIVWEWMSWSGDLEFTQDTFRKIAKEVLSQHE